MIEILPASDALRLDTEWNDLAQEAEYLMAAGDPHGACAAVFKLIGHVLENPISQSQVRLCRRIMDDFLVAFDDWDEDD